jgi:hypothetical protein
MKLYRCKTCGHQLVSRKHMGSHHGHEWTPAVNLTCFEKLRKMLWEIRD